MKSMLTDQMKKDEEAHIHTGLIKATWSEHAQKSSLITNTLQELKDNVNSNNKPQAFVQALTKPAAAYSIQSPMT